MKKFLSMILLSSSLVFADNNTIGLDTVVGATIGVAIGNQIGKGNGKDVARVAGGLLGASIANNSRTPSYNNNVYYEDKVGDMLNKSDVLKNAPKHDVTYIEVVGVLND